MTSANFLYIVDADPAKGYFSSIQSAINAAAADGGGTVNVHPGTYTENLVLPSVGTHQIQVFGIASAENPAVLIEGTHTFQQSGIYGFSSLKFHYGSGTIWTISSGAGDITFDHCKMAADSPPTGQCIHSRGNAQTCTIKNCSLEAAQEVIVAANAAIFYVENSSLLTLIGVLASNVSLSGRSTFTSWQNTYQVSGGDNISVSGSSIYSSQGSDYNPNNSSNSIVKFTGPGTVKLSNETVRSFEPNGYYIRATGVFVPTPTLVANVITFADPGTAKNVGPNISVMKAPISFNVKE